MEETHRGATSVPDTAAELSAGAIELLLMHIVRHIGTFDMANAELDPDMFSRASEMHYRHIWRSIKEHYITYNRIPAYESLCVTVLDAVAADPIAYGDADTGQMLHEHTLSILDFMYSSGHTEDTLEPAVAANILRTILTVRGPEEVLRRAVAQAPHGGVANLAAVVTSAEQRIQAIGALGRSTAETELSQPDSFARPAAMRLPTGVDFVDRILGGGSAPGDCNVILGPTGGGKTTLAMQLAVATARLQHQMSVQGVGDPGFVAYIGYEDGFQMLQIRATSYAARVMKERLQFLETDADLSRIGNLQPYEQAMYSSNGNPDELLGEVERMEQTKPWMRKHLAMVDYYDKTIGGRGGVQEIRQKVSAMQEKRGMAVKMIVIDWAGLMASNHLEAMGHGPDGGRLSIYLQDVVKLAKQELAATFGSTVWVVHQLKG